MIELGPTMTTQQQRLSIFQKAARERWPNNYREHKTIGDGQFLVAGCTFFHPSARCLRYGKLYLFESLEKAKRFADAMDRGTADACCHARSKGRCKGRHQVDRLPDELVAHAN
jgi:hypothetical protein